MATAEETQINDGGEKLKGTNKDSSCVLRILKFFLILARFKALYILRNFVESCPEKTVGDQSESTNQT